MENSKNKINLFLEPFPNVCCPWVNYIGICDYRLDELNYKVVLTTENVLSNHKGKLSEIVTVFAVKYNQLILDNDIILQWAGRYI